MRIFTCDLDSTLCDTSARFADHSSRDTPIDWAAYAMDCSGDPPFEGTVRLVRALQESSLYSGWWVVSARDEASRELTAAWLKEQDLYPMGILLGGAPIDATSHADYKAKQIRSLQEDGFTVEFHLEDHEPVRDAVKKMCDVPVIVIYPGYDGLR